MALRLVRQTSDTPSITNRDDAKMVRYAYGGFDGVVKNVGSELDYSATGGNFTINSGRIVLQGWEVDVSDEGWNLSILNATGYFYYSIYLEINLITETADIKSTYAVASYPEIDKGDDLTENSEGIARLLLYKVKSRSGAIDEVIKSFEVIDYLKDYIQQLRDGSFKYNDIVTRKKLLWSGNIDIGAGITGEELGVADPEEFTKITSSSRFNSSPIEVHFKFSEDGTMYRSTLKISSKSSPALTVLQSGVFANDNNRIDLRFAGLWLKGNELFGVSYYIQHKPTNTTTTLLNQPCYVTAIYEIIE